jgi:NodT family efflux transporter outer membrane factor (OMF) lipoprotein
MRDHLIPLMSRRPLRTAPAALTLALVLAGCANLAPEHRRPEAPVPATLSASLDTAAPAVAPAAVPVPPTWQQFVTSPRQKALVERALAANRDLRVAALAVERARAQAQLTDADRGPTVSGGLIASRAPNTQGVQTTTLNAGLQLSSWEVDLFGRLRNLDDAARASLVGSEAGRRATELSVVAAVLSADLGLAADQSQLALARRTLASREQTAALTQLREKVGAASLLERQSTDALLAQARSAVAQLERQVALDRHQLDLLVGESVPPSLRPPVAEDEAAFADTPTGLADVPAGLGAEVLQRRPDVIQAEQALVAANANIGAARAALWPRITLTGSAGSVSNELSGLFSSGTFAWTLGAQALATVFDGGRGRANVAAATVSRDIAVAQYEKTVQTAFRETADALAGQATWQRQREAAVFQRDAAREIARLTELRWQQGAANELERQEAQRAWWQAEQALAQTRLAEALNRIALFKALGG